MTGNFVRATWTLLAGALLVGCGSGGGGNYKPRPEAKVAPATVAPGDEASLFPFKVGNKWVFEVEGETLTTQAKAMTRSSVTFQVTGIVDGPNGKDATIKVTTEAQNGEKRSTNQKWRVNDKGIFQLLAGVNEIPFNPPQPILPFPAEKGKRVQYKGTGAVATKAAGTLSGYTEVLGPQEVDTGGGRLSAIACQMAGDWSGPDDKGKTVKGKFGYMVWFAPKIGPVRIRTELATEGASAYQTLRLKEHKLQ
ncbi:MAG: hypothetical protein KIS66_10060 [Fimbriimonadaceae bacterium]|nr:hypothetical protein [Fimbriimonadaceae bacterium]